MKKEFLYGIILAILYLCMVYIIPRFNTVEHFEEESAPDRLLKPFVNPTGSLVALTGKITDTLRASDIVLTPMRVMNDMTADTEPKICMDIKDPIKGGNTLTETEKQLLEEHTDMTPKDIDNLEELCIDKTMIQAANELNDKYGVFLKDLNYVNTTVQGVNKWADGTYLNNTSSSGKSTLLDYLNDNFYTNNDLYTKSQSDNEFEQKITGMPLTMNAANTRYVTLQEIGGAVPLIESEGDSRYQRKEPNIDYMTTADAMSKFLRHHSQRGTGDSSPYATRSFLDQQIIKYDTQISDARDTVKRAYDAANPDPTKSAAAAAALSQLEANNPGSQPGTTTR